MSDFETFLRDNLPVVDTFHPHYQRALQEMLIAGGKRFRPKLLLGIVSAYEPLLVDSAMIPALALEVFHTYSLIHDDLPAMDDAGFRRGHPTLHTTYSESLAILVGDGLNTWAFELIANAPFRDDVKLELIKILAHNGGVEGMILGQAIDLEFENKPLILEEVEELHRNKTAKLIASSLEMGAVIVGLDSKTRKELYQFGIDLGLLFQVQDDIIDATLSSEEAGKPTDNDSDKNSFVSLLGLDGAIEYSDTLADKLYRKFESFDKPLKDALSKLMQDYLYRHRKNKQNGE